MTVSIFFNESTNVSYLHPFYSNGGAGNEVLIIAGCGEEHAMAACVHLFSQAVQGDDGRFLIARQKKNCFCSFCFGFLWTKHARDLRRLIDRMGCKHRPVTVREKRATKSRRTLQAETNRKSKSKWSSTSTSTTWSCVSFSITSDI